MRTAFHSQHIRAFIFDFYGTLVEDEVSPPEPWRWLADRGYAATPALQALFEPNAFDGIETPSLSDDPSHADWILENWLGFARMCGVPDAVLRQTVGGLLLSQETFRPRCVPGASRLLHRLRRNGLKVGLCSNWETPIEPMLHACGLRTADFDAVCTSAEIGARKPHRMIFDTICRRLGIRPHEAVFVGDSWSADIVGALRAGLHAVWLSKQGSPNPLSERVPRFESLAALADRYCEPGAPTAPHSPTPQI